MRKELSDALTTLFNTVNSFHTALTGGLYLNHAPQNASFPYGVFFEVVEIPTWEFTTSASAGEVEIAQVQFSIYDRPANNDPTGIQNLRTYLTALFDWCRLSISGWTFIAMQRVDTRPMRFEEAQNVWLFHVTYKIWYGK